ncbi:5-(carboxyamino)imidazole ribonucleotide synthase [Acanthopleuribacter pedis]|uniref:N5-carboxyaminoimidazole ribonucleotide synthase n=1 Tax=Acanthopleuribacter pedis TaxID=442870 RepID=A0A8J7QAW3_9BACT|nr:5-(carboxyamino)imidazole ribonucleotide synthase [Acanthopleuribacter pedis]MBO1320790.1 5-(carboxyamino)imidazole ribonucleotide synthase [Acanthopleuribacter pedis]
MTQYWSSSFTLGILGGGQLGKMLLDETARLDIHTAVLDPSAEAPSVGRTNRFVQGKLMDYQTVLDFGRSVNLVTCEIEHINIDALRQLEKEGIPVRPSPEIFATVGNKAHQKAFYQRHGIPTLPFFTFETKAEMLEKLGPLPVVWKAATGGYDGRGVAILRNQEDVDAVPDVPGLIEDYVGAKREISILIARNPSGETQAFPAVEMVFHPTANLVQHLHSPSSLAPELAARAKEIAEQVAEKFDLAGITAVEMFVTPGNKIYVNEIAPRPHNSGHHTIESHFTSQHEQHLRGILDLPLGSPRALFPAVMLNILGGPDTGAPIYRGLVDIMKEEGVYPHIYGKTETRPFRKMGHITLIGATLDEALARAERVRNMLTVNGQ